MHGRSTAAPPLTLFYTDTISTVHTALPTGHCLARYINTFMVLLMVFLSTYDQSLFSVGQNLRLSSLDHPP